MDHIPKHHWLKLEKKRDDARELLAQKIDPKEYKDDQLREKQLAAGNTFESVTTQWFAIKKTKIAETTARSLWRNFENNVFPKLGHRPIDKILAPEAISVLTTLYSYGDVPDYRQAELIKKLNQPREIVSDKMEAMVLATMQKMMGSPKT